MREQSDLIRGMMFRDSLPKNRGMLFFHMREVPASYYMFQVKIPLDIIWMDHNHQIVEIARNVPPCPSNAAQACPTYGGKSLKQFAAGSERRFRSGQRPARRRPVGILERRTARMYLRGPRF